MPAGRSCSSPTPTACSRKTRCARRRHARARRPRGRGRRHLYPGAGRPAVLQPLPVGVHPLLRDARPEPGLPRHARARDSRRGLPPQRRLPRGLPADPGGRGVQPSAAPPRPPAGDEPGDPGAPCVQLLGRALAHQRLPQIHVLDPVLAAPARSPRRLRHRVTRTQGERRRLCRRPGAAGAGTGHRRAALGRGGGRGARPQPVCQSRPARRVPPRARSAVRARRRPVLPARLPVARGAGATAGVLRYPRLGAPREAR